MMVAVGPLRGLPEYLPESFASSLFTDHKWPMVAAASFKAASGEALPVVAICNAAPTELKKRPICGMFGITSPASTQTLN